MDAFGAATRSAAGAWRMKRGNMMPSMRTLQALAGADFMLKFPDLKGSESVSSKSPWFPHKRSLCGNLSLWQERDQRELWHWLWRTWFIRPSARNCAVLKFASKDQLDQLDQSSVQQYWSCMWYDDVWCIIQRILHDVLYCRYCLSSNKW